MVYRAEGNQSGHINTVIWGSYSGEESMWLQNPCRLQVPKVDSNRSGHISPTFLGSLKKCGYITRAVLGSQKLRGIGVAT